ncbi:MAG: AI-2E family transporter, partial [Clostridia bacterium]|nr:AI-2E family transporter [Clostridia bacterium]
MADSAPRRRGAAAAVTAGTAVGASPSGGPHGRRAWRWLAGAASVVAAAALAYLLRSVLWPFVLAAFLAYALAPAVEAGTARGLPRATATLLVFAAAGGAVVGVGAWVLPALAAEWVRAGDAIVQIAAQLEALQVSVERRYAPLLPALDLREALGSALERLQGQVLRDAGAVVANLPAWFQTLAGVALSPFLAYYMLRDLPRFREVFHRSLPPGWR